VKFIAGAVDALPLLLAAFVLAFVVAILFTPRIRRVAVRLRMVDWPGYRRVNTRPVARGGGLAIALAFLLVALGLTLLNAITGLVPMPVLLRDSHLVALFGGGAAAAALGVLDDYLDLRARWQFAGQLALGFAAVALGIGIASIQNPFSRTPIFFDDPVPALLAIVWIVGMINSVNFIDGLDGLSSGIGLIAAVTLGVLSLTTSVGQPYVAVLCLALAGALAGFLRWNFHPARVFPGTGGTMFLGYTFWIIVRRVAGGRSPFTPDRGHIHHRLLDLGLSHRQTVVLIYAICVGLGALSLLLSAQNQVYAFIGVLIATGIALFALTRGNIAAEALEPRSYDDPARDVDVG
jgi:UDP-GlcNAc:undecaprenyl-phosphate GlcNAc-1-phosphate transferase